MQFPIDWWVGSSFFHNTLFLTILDQVLKSTYANPRWLPTHIDPKKRFLFNNLLIDVHNTCIMSHIWVIFQFHEKIVGGTAQSTHKNFDTNFPRAYGNDDREVRKQNWAKFVNHVTWFWCNRFWLWIKHWNMLFFDDVIPGQNDVIGF